MKHVSIHTKQIIPNSIKHFPNATELTIKQYFKTYGDSIPRTLNRIVRLKKLTKLVMHSYAFPFEEIIRLICYTPNLHTLQIINSSSFVEINSELIQQTGIFRTASNTNNIKYLDLHVECTLEKIRFIVNLFPKLEYLKIGMKKNKEIKQIVRLLLLNKTHHLFMLCLSEISKRYLEELNILIQSENLLNNYLIKFFNHDLYLWFE